MIIKKCVRCDNVYCAENDTEFKKYFKYDAKDNAWYSICKRCISFLECVRRVKTGEYKKVHIKDPRLNKNKKKKNYKKFIVL